MLQRHSREYRACQVSVKRPISRAIRSHWFEHEKPKVMVCNATLLFFACVLYLASTDAFAIPKLVIKSKEYQIEGATAPDLLREMEAKSPCREKEKIYQGCVSAKLRGQYITTRVPWGLFCIVTKTALRADVTINMPNWTKYQTANPNLKDWWDKFYSSLTIHELGHIDLAEKISLGTRENRLGYAQIEL